MYMRFPFPDYHLTIVLKWPKYCWLDIKTKQKNKTKQQQQQKQNKTKQQQPQTPLNTWAQLFKASLA